VSPSGAKMSTVGPRRRRPRAQDELGGGIELQGGVEQVRDALLARDPPDEDHGRARRVDPVPLEHAGGAVGRVLLRVDPVVDHPHALGVDRRVGGEHVAAHALRDRDHGVGGFERDALAEARERVAAAELLRLPRPQRLEAVDGGDVRHVVGEPGQVPREVRVPGVAVHHLGARGRRGHREVDRHGPQRGQVRLLSFQRLPRPMGHDTLARRGVGGPIVHRDLLQPRQLAGEVLDVHAGAAVDLRRVLAGEQRDAHA